MAGLGIAGLGPTCEVKVEVCGWEGKQQHPIYQRCRGRAAFPDPGCLTEHFTSPRQRCRAPRAPSYPRVRPRGWQGQAHPPWRGKTLPPILQPALGASSTCPPWGGKTLPPVLQPALGAPSTCPPSVQLPKKLGMPQPALPLPRASVGPWGFSRAGGWDWRAGGRGHGGVS